MNALQFEIEVIACPLCGTRDHERPFLDEDLGTRFVRCERCCSVYLNPRPGAASRDAYYLQTEKHIQSQLRIAESRRPAFALITKAVRECKPGGSLLDVGCNTGGLFDYFDLREWRCFGIEPDANLAAYTGITHDAGPWRLTGRRGAKSVIELPGGECRRRGIEIGAKLRVDHGS